MKFIRIGFVAVLLLLLVVPVGWAKGDKVLESASDECKVTVNLVYPGPEDVGYFSTWTYEVSEPVGKCKDLSNWALVLPDDAVVVSAEGPEGSSYEVGPNPHFNNQYSIKWDVTDKFESGTFSFTLDDSYYKGSVEYAAKAGRTLYTDETTGPVECGSYPG
jgi:hypothetical protein